MLAGAVVAPHGDEILVPENPDMERLNKAMKIAGEHFSDVDGYIVISPHNIRIDTHIGVILTEHLYGRWEWQNVVIEKELSCDRALAHELYRAGAGSGVPVVGINFGALEGELSRMPLDWGSLIPLYFFRDKPAVLITPARGITREELLKFGEVLGEVLERYEKRTVMIVSADQAHTHSERGPYGFSESAAVYDAEINKILKKGELELLLNLPDALVDAAMPDSYWQLLMLAGASRRVKMRPIMVEYAIADYFGMTVAIYDRADVSGSR